MIEVEITQDEIDARNAAFWNELCGTQMAQHLGVTDSSPESLKKFDDWYFSFYPYLDDHIPFATMKDKKVLEVGLGYGTVSQRLAESGADYTGLDIAAGPPAMVRHRLAQNDLPGTAVEGSILNAPFADESFDWIVAIGCFHHTGNFQRALDESYRMLKPGGKAMVMVYFAYSYRRWLSAPRSTFQQLLTDKFGINLTDRGHDQKERALYDASTVDGTGAPETEFFSASEVRRMTRQWSSKSFRLENIGQDGPFRAMPRHVANRFFGPIMGLDIYMLLEK